MNLTGKQTPAGKHYIRCVTAILLLSSVVSGCASFSDSSATQAEQETAAGTSSTTDAETTVDESESEKLTQTEQQVKALEQQLESLKVEWAQQKPALERLVSNEADLEFLVQALADMSQLSEEPSRSQYLGQDELTPQKREESLQALQSLVSTQEDLNTLLVELSTVVSEVASTRQDAQGQNSATGRSGNHQTMSADTAASSAETSVIQTTTTSAGATVGSETTVAVMPVSQGDCNCSSAESSAPVHSDTARSRDPSWFAMTTPYAEATPAGGVNQVSQLDAAASGLPIPGLQVKTFKRRTLPSELAAAGADMQQYAMAPQFHMSRKSLTDYVSQLAFKLAGNQQLAGNKVGVASFVFFDEQLEQTSAVGNQLAEELSTLLPNYGAKVIEYKLTREITVGPSGDLSLSRNTKKLRDTQGMDYVLTGTMVPTRRGLQINSRVVSTRDNVVIASASTLIPAMVLQQL
jgi:TolB-like protein/TolA-binding protein